MPTPEQIDQQFLVLINRERAVNGLSLVTLNPALDNAAQNQSNYIATHGWVVGPQEHLGANGSTLNARVTESGYTYDNLSQPRENIAAGHFTPAEAVQDWLNSPEHRANILHPDLLHIGVGHTFRDNDPDFYFDYWTLVLAKGATTPPPPVTTPPVNVVETPVPETPAPETPIDETPDQTPAPETPGETPGTEVPVSETPDETNESESETPVNETPDSDSETSGETPETETPADETPESETPTDSNLPEDSSSEVPTNTPEDDVAVPPPSDSTEEDRPETTIPEDTTESSEENSSDQPIPTTLETISGGEATGLLLGTNGNDFLEAGPEITVVAGIGGNDLIIGSDNDDVLRGDLNERASGGANDGDDLIFGGAGNDRIGGKGGNDQLVGGLGNDEIWGDAGDDILQGGLGNDTLTGDDRSGGTGADTFILAAGAGTDLIMDFEVGIDLIGLVGDVEFADLSLGQGTNGATIALDGEILATLKGVSRTQLTSDQFIAAEEITYSPI